MDDDQALDWQTAPASFRRAHERLHAQLVDAEAEADRLRRLVAGTERCHREVIALRALGADTLDSDAGVAFIRSYSGEVTVEEVRAAWGRFRGAVQRLADDFREAS